MFRLPLKPIPLIVRVVSNIDALAATPSTLPVITNVSERLNPFLRLRKPGTVLGESIVNSVSAIIPYTVPFMVIKITG